MIELIIFLSKYIFLILIFIFCLQSFYLVTKGRNITYPSAESTSAVKLQRITIVLFHILSYAVLYFNSQIPLEDFLTTAVGGLVLVIFMPVFIALVYNRINGLAINCMYFLMDISLVVLQRLNPALALKQMIYFFIGTGIILLIKPILKFTRNLYKLKYVYLFLGAALILLTFVLGKTTRGATNWIYIGNFSFQPSEIVKLLFVFYYASVFCRSITFKQTVGQMCIGAAFVAALVLQRDLGSALIFFTTLVIVMFISTSNLFLTAVSLAMAAAGSVAAYHLFSHIRVRVSAWQNPWDDIANSGYQIAQSLFAIGSGGLWGSGIGKGYATFIPIVENDFIFSAICEEFGIIFAVFVILIYLTLIYSGVRSALNTSDKFKAILASGLTALIAFQTFLIIGGVTKFIPMTGVTLPLISYGGTSAVITTIIIGILLWIYEPKAESSAEKYGPDDKPPKQKRRSKRTMPSPKNYSNPNEGPLRNRVRG